MWLYLVAIHLLLSLASTDGTRLAGTFTYHDDVVHDYPLVYLDKFGVKKGHTFNMYGSSRVIDYDPKNNFTSVYLAFTPSTVWDNVTKEANKHGLNNMACNDTYYQLFGSPCPTNVLASNTYLRTMPCKEYKGFGACLQPTTLPPPPSNEFLYQYSSLTTEFWYAYFVICSQNRSVEQLCEWKTSDRVDFQYNYSIVYSNYNNPDQVPANYQGLLPFYGVFSGLYILLISIHCILNSPLCMRKEQKVHLLVYLYTVAMVLEALNIVCGLVHYSIFTHNGIGVSPLVYLKDALNIVSDWFLIVILVLVAGGWQVTLKNVKWKHASIGVCSFYILFTVVYYVGEVVREGEWVIDR